MSSLEEPPSKLEKFKVYYEMDMTYREARKQVKKRTIKDGKSS